VSFQAQSRDKKHSMPTLAAVTLAVGVLALAGCGGSSNTNSSTTAPATTPSTPTSSSTASTSTSSSTSPSGALSLEANAEGQLKYNKTTLSANAGKVSIDFTNMSPLGHNMTIESSAGKIVGATPTFQGGTKLLTLDLKAGTYKFFCSVPGHRMAGMEGTLTVK
jgi:plastocyanin